MRCFYKVITISSVLFRFFLLLEQKRCCFVSVDPMSLILGTLRILLKTYLETKSLKLAFIHSKLIFKSNHAHPLTGKWRRRIPSARTSTSSPVRSQRSSHSCCTLQMHKDTDATLFWHILLPHNRNACNESTKVYCIFFTPTQVRNQVLRFGGEKYF